MLTTAGQLVSALEDGFKQQITQSYNRVVDIGMCVGLYESSLYLNLVLNFRETVSTCHIIDLFRNGGQIKYSQVLF